MRKSWWSPCSVGALAILLLWADVSLAAESDDRAALLEQEQQLAKEIKRYELARQIDGARAASGKLLAVRSTLYPAEHWSCRSLRQALREYDLLVASDPTQASDRLAQLRKLLEQGQAAISKQQFLSALFSGKELKELAQEYLGQNSYFGALGCLIEGRAKYESRNFHSAATALESAGLQLDELIGQAAPVYVYSQIYSAKSYLADGKRERAVAIGLRCEKLANDDSQGFSADRIQCLAQTADLLVALKQFKSAGPIADKVRERVAAIKESDPNTWAPTNFAIGKTFSALGRSADARACFVEIEEAFQAHPGAAKAVQAAMQEAIAREDAAAGQFVEALARLDRGLQMLETAEAASDTLVRLSIRLQISDIQLLLDKPELVRAQIVLARQDLNELDFGEVRNLHWSQWLVRELRLALRSNNLAAARKAAQKYAEIQGLGARRNQDAWCEYLLELALLELASNDTAAAMKWLAQAETNCSDQADQLYPRLKYCQSKAFQALDRRQEAIAAVKDGIQAAESSFGTDHACLYEMLLLLENLLTQNKQADEAKQAGQRARRIAERHFKVER